MNTIIKNFNNKTMSTAFKQMFDRLKKNNEELEVKRMTQTDENPNLPDNENEWEYHEYLKRLETEDLEEYELWSDYPYK